MTYRSAIEATPSLIAYWRLGEKSGTTAADRKGSLNGTYTSGFTLGAPGGPSGDQNTAIACDGASTSLPVVVPHNLSLRISGPVTIEVLVFPADFNQAGSGGSPAILAKESAPGVDGYSLHLNSSGHVVFSTAGLLDSGSPDTVGATPLRLNAWSLIQISTDLSHKWIRVNNMLDATSGALTGSVTPNTSPLVFGNTSAGGRAFKGRLDEVDFCNAVVDAAILDAHFKAFSAPVTLTRGYRLANPNVEVDLAVNNDRDASEAHHTGESGVAMDDAEAAFLQKIGVLPPSQAAQTSGSGRWDWSWAIPRQSA